MPPPVVLTFPFAGVDASAATTRQPKGTTPDALNVRLHGWADDRARGGSRPGLERFCPDRINTTLGPYDPHSIQDINQIVTGESLAPTDAGQFVYARAADNGFGLGTRAGASYFTGGGVASYIFVNSCWDVSLPLATVNYAYVTQARTINDDESAISLFKVSSAGVLIYTKTDLLVVATGGAGHRKVAGMAVVGEFLYVAVTEFNTPVAKIYKIDKQNGDVVGGTHWVSNSSTGLSDMRFSTAAVNNLAGFGSLLGVVSAGSAADNFFILNASTGAVVASTGSVGASTNSRTRVDTDGVFFYAVMNSGDGDVCKIRADGTIVWTWTDSANDTNTLCYDRATNRVFVLNVTSGALYRLNPNTGTLVGTTASPAGATTWDNIDTDGSGRIFLWSNSVASNDVAAIGPSLTTTDGFAAGTFANAVHFGASVNRGAGAQAVGRSRILVVSGGRLSRITREAAVVVSGGQAWSGTANVVPSAQNGLHMYYVDGISYSRYDSEDDVVEAWTASAGSLPTDDNGMATRLIAACWDRIIVSGLPGQPQNIFASRSGDATDFDTSPSPFSPLQAFALNAADLGLIGDAVTCLAAWNADTLVVGGDHTLTVMAGDPLDGGRLDVASRIVGMPFGRPFCVGPDGTLYFFASRGGVMYMRPGSHQPHLLSPQVQDRLRKVDVGANQISMAWDYASGGLWTFITPFDQTETATHWFWEARNNAWWPATFARRKQNPKCCHPLDDDHPDDRIVLTGSWDSYVRGIDGDDATDDGLSFESFVWLGPIQTGVIGDVMLRELQGILGVDSGDVSVSVHAGRTPQEAMDSDAVYPDVTLEAGRNATHNLRRSGYAVMLKLSSAAQWQFEALRVVVEDLGLVRGRGR